MLVRKEFFNKLLGRYEEALRFITAACAIQPDDYIVHCNQGKVFQELKRYAEALASYDRTLSLKSDYAPAYYNRGSVLYDLQRNEDALASYDKAIALIPGYAEAYNNRGNVLKDLQRYAEALASYDKAIALNPGYALAYNNRGTALEQLGRYQEALACYAKVIALKPDLAPAYNNQGNVLKELGRYQEALASYDSALSLKPDYAEAHNNRGNALKDLGRYEEALASYSKAISLYPDFAEAYYNKSHLKLLLGDYKEGWPLYEWRWKTSQKDLVRNFKQPLWLGDRPIAGQTILLHAEQGLGDVIQMVRYVTMVEALGATVILELPASLVPLLRTLKGASTLVASGDTLPAFDLHCPLMTLPLAFKTSVDSIPAPVPYLAADPQKLLAWRERLGIKGSPRIGLAWSGNPQHKNDRNRSTALRTFEPLLGLDCEYHALQKEIRAEDKLALAEFTDIQAHEDQLKDFADTAALVAELDLVITVDSSVAHLAGAMGKAVWILLPYDPDYRWLTARSDSPWYPTVRLFRQHSIGDWEGVIRDISSVLGCFVLERQ